MQGIQPCHQKLDFFLGGDTGLHWGEALPLFCALKPFEVVIDVLAMARGPTLVNHLKSVKRSLRLSPKSVKAAED
ncbi:hypothetical protein D3C76_1388700 [compost metagenome]